MSTSLQYDRSYFKTNAAIIKCSCLFCCLVGFLCILCSSVRLHNLRGSFYLSVIGIGFISSSCLLFVGAFQLWQRKFYNLNAVKYEMYVNGFMALVTFIAAAITCSMDVLTYSIATFFGFFAACLYAYEAYMCYCLNRKCDAATQTESKLKSCSGAV